MACFTLHFTSIALQFQDTRFTCPTVSFFNYNFQVLVYMDFCHTANLLSMVGKQDLLPQRFVSNP